MGMTDTYFEKPPTTEDQLWFDEAGHRVATVEPRGTGAWGVTCDTGVPRYYLIGEHAGGYAVYTDSGPSKAVPSWPDMITALIENQMPQ